MMLPNDEHTLARPTFASVAEYGQRFADAAFWQPYVQVACRYSGIACHEVGMGIAGTYPTFFVDGRFVVKFHGELFDGAHSYAVEREVYRLLAQLPGFLAPVLVAEGQLFPADEGWPWPYLIVTLLPGVSLSQVAEQIPAEDKRSLARRLGVLARQLHSLPLDGATTLAPTWDAFTQFLEQRRAACVADQRHWQSLPELLIDQIESYLLPTETLIDRAQPPRLVHADIHEDHVLVQRTNDHWSLTGIIDFGDAAAGDPFYELVAVHLGAFYADKSLLAAFLGGYDWPMAADFVHRAMSYALLFPFNAFGPVLRRSPELAQVESLDEFAQRLWSLDVS